jgi:hypothetical protein
MYGYVEFEVSLVHVKPRIWRRFLLRDSSSFEDLHHAIQDAFGWENEHLWRFSRVGRAGAAIAGRDGDDTPDARDVDIASVFNRSVIDRCRYVYDFGDRWEHEVKGRRSNDPDLDARRRLLAGERACPPENCGGVSGYEACCEFVATGMHPWQSAAEFREWLGDWNPDAFDLDAARKRFDRD